MKNKIDDSITIYEDWDEIDGKIYYKWRLLGDVAWHMKETAYKQKPIIRFKQISKIEFDEFYGDDAAIAKLLAEKEEK